jgi:Nitrile hydratase, alpha chain
MKSSQRRTKKTRTSPKLDDSDRVALRAWHLAQYGVLRQKAFVQIVGSALADSGFRARLLAEPKKMLKHFDVKLPRGVEIKVVENTGETVYLVLPHRSKAASEKRGDLTDADLKSAAYVAWQGPEVLAFLGEGDLDFGDIVKIKLGGDGRDRTDTRVGADVVDGGRDAGPGADFTDSKDTITLGRDKDKGDRGRDK